MFTGTSVVMTLLTREGRSVKNTAFKMAATSRLMGDAEVWDHSGM